MSEIIPVLIHLLVDVSAFESDRLNVALTVFFKHGTRNIASDTALPNLSPSLRQKCVKMEIQALFQETGYLAQLDKWAIRHSSETVFDSVVAVTYSDSFPRVRSFGSAIKKQQSISEQS